MLLACQLYFDFSGLVQKEKNIWNGDYIIISKEVSSIKTFTRDKTVFEEEEINDIKKQSFTKDLGVFEPALFSVDTQIGQSASMPYFSTDLFFESLPDRFLDIENDEWKWKEGDTFVPIILPKNYLDLYNFGFALSKGLPQVSEGVFSQIPFTIRIANGTETLEFKARVVDFSDRLNTILVPQDFMTWANQKYGNNAPKEVSRLIIKTDTSANPDILKYLNDRGYESDKEKLKNSKLGFYLQIAFSIVLIVGGIIVMSSLWLLLINFQLIIEKSKDRIKSLFHLGYSVRILSKPYIILAFGFSFITIFISLILLYYVRSYWTNQFHSMVTIESQNFLYTVLIALSLGVIVFVFNMITLRRMLLKAVEKV